MRKTKADQIFDLLNNLIMALVLFIMVYPLYFTIIASISEPHEVALGNIALLPRGLTFEAYTNVFKSEQIWTGYRNSIIYTLFGTIFNLFLTIPAAYVLSKRDLPGRTAISGIFLFTMYFGGGLVPSYLLVKDLGLLDKPYTLIILSGISIYNLVVTRVFYQSSIPDSLYEAASIDGSSELNAFFMIAIPLSAPIIAVIALYYAVSRWNDYFTALVYTSSREYQPLQLVLRQILILNQQMLSKIDFSSDDGSAAEVAQRIAYMAQAMKYSVILIASAPMLIMYPFVQKHFVKGVMIGSLKG